MLQIVVPSGELWDERTETFIRLEKSVSLSLEHSLVSLSKWESRWGKPFLGRGEKTPEETIDYVRCMTITQNVNPDVYLFLSSDNIKEVNSYIEAPMTATWFAEDKSGGSNREQITSELIYYWMIALNIPFECQKWHLNRLLTLVKVCNVKNQPAKKMGTKELLARNAALNAARKKQMNTKG